MDFLYSALLILVVIAIFNVIIFVHELGHFLAAKWRGVQVDRFQIWFGKPIWKKTINGVQYGLGWIPAGGFVALPQMAPMESIEGGNREGKPLPKISPIDKIIVAFAGPLFSVLLAFAAAVVVWNVGKPKDALTNTVIGAVADDSPAAKAGLLPGDKILEVDGESVKWFAGSLDAVSERIMLTKRERIEFKVDRGGETMTFTSDFDIADTSFFQRRALPKVGLYGSGPAIIGSIIKGATPGPAEIAGLQVGDEIIEVNGEKIYGDQRVMQLVKKAGETPVNLKIKRGEEILAKTITPLVPEGDYYNKPMFGVGFDRSQMYDSTMVYPNPLEQIKDTVNQMWITISSVASPKSNVGVDQLAGPIGIAHLKFRLLLTEDGWYRLLFMLVLFNVNLAILNMLPFPVLDGGHIVMAISEMLSGKPMNARFLEVVQTGFALMLMGFMIFVSTKDFAALVGGEEKGPKPPKEIVWPTDPKNAG